MATTINRTNYNLLADASAPGAGDGTNWTKNQVKIVILDPIDAMFAGALALGSNVTIAGTLAVTGATTLTGGITGGVAITGAVTISTTLGVSGLTTLAGLTTTTLVVSSTSSFAGAMGANAITATTNASTRPFQALGSDSATSAIVASFYSNTSGRASAIQFSDAFTFNLGIGSDSAGNFNVWAARNPGNAGTNVYTVGATGLSTLLLPITASGASYHQINTTGGSTYFGIDSNTASVFGMGNYSVVIYTDSAGGIGINSTNAAGTVRVYTVNTLRNQTLASGHFVPGADNTYNLGTTGTMRWKDIFAVTKTSSLDVSWGSKNVLVSVLEGPEYRLYDSATVHLDGTGHLDVLFDVKFVEVVNLDMPYQVLTSGATVSNKTTVGFRLTGDADTYVDYLVVAVRAGFENVRWRDPSTETAEPMGLHDPWEARSRKHTMNNTANERPRREAKDLPSFVEDVEKVIPPKLDPLIERAIEIEKQMVEAEQAEIAKERS